MRFRTFSSINAGGSFSFKIRSISKKSVPHVSFEKPSFFPIIENAWQGKPPNKISKSGISFASIFVMSPDGCSPKLASYVLQASSSNSEENTHLPPTCSNPNLIPPIPANKSINLNEFQSINIYPHLNTFQSFLH